MDGLKSNNVNIKINPEKYAKLSLKRAEYRKHGGFDCNSFKWEHNEHLILKREHRKRNASNNCEYIGDEEEVKHMTFFSFLR